MEVQDDLQHESQLWQQSPSKTVIVNNNNLVEKHTESLIKRNRQFVKQNPLKK